MPATHFLRLPRRRLLAAGLALALAADAAAAEPAAPAGVIATVTNCNDDGPGSLREAYFNAVDGETIDLSQLTCSTITLSSGVLTNAPSATSVTLEGPGKYELTIDGGHNGRVLVHNGSGSLTLTDVTIAHGSYHGQYGGGCIYSAGDVVLQGANVTDCEMSSSGIDKALGGAIYAQGSVRTFGATISASTAHADAANSGGGGIWARSAGVYFSTITGCTVSGDGTHYGRGGGVYSLSDARILYSTIANNEAISGAGAYLVGATSYAMYVADSTISGNRALGAGGGLFAKYAPLSIANATISQNTAGFEFGAGVYLATDTTLESTIVAGNTSQDGLFASDVGGSASIAIAGSHNLVVASTLPLPADTLSAEPELGPLQDNGGLTATHALAPTSPAIDHGSNSLGFQTDQRYYDLATSSVYERSVGPAPDIGAFEFGAPDRIFYDGFDAEPAAAEPLR